MAMARAVRRGRSLRQVARRFRVGLATVHRWVRRAGRGRLDRVEWTNRPSIAHDTRRTPRTLEERVLSLRQQLKTSDLSVWRCGHPPGVATREPRLPSLRADRGAD